MKDTYQIKVSACSFGSEPQEERDLTPIKEQLEQAKTSGIFNEIVFRRKNLVARGTTYLPYWNKYPTKTMAIQKEVFSGAQELSKKYQSFKFEAIGEFNDTYKVCASYINGRMIQRESVDEKINNELAIHKTLSRKWYKYTEGPEPKIEYFVWEDLFSKEGVLDLMCIDEGKKYSRQKWPYDEAYSAREVRDSLLDRKEELEAQWKKQNNRRSRAAEALEKLTTQPSLWSDWSKYNKAPELKMVETAPFLSTYRQV